MDNSAGIRRRWKKISFTNEILPGLLVIAALALAAVELWHKGYSTFRSYDDQGYIMLTLKQYRQGYPLYDTLFSQYGPAYYIFRDWIYGSAVITHDLTTAVSIAHAILCCVIVGIITYLCTRSLWGVALGVALTPKRVFIFFNESGHPQEFLCVLVLLATLAVISPLLKNVRAVILGFLVAVMTMVKINLGILMLLPLLLLFIQEAPRGRLRSVSVSLLIACLIVSPFLLMRNHLQESWGFAFAFMICTSTIFLIFTTRGSSSNPGWNQFVWFCLAMGGTTLGIVVHEIFRGTTPGGLLRGILLQPMGLSTIFLMPFPIGPLSNVLSSFAGIAFWVGVFGKCSRALICSLCFALGLGLCVLLSTIDWDFPFKYLIPFVWLVPLARAIRLGNPCAFSLSGKLASNRLDEPRNVYPPESHGLSEFANGFLLLTSVFLILQGYPVARDQIFCGTILLPVVGILALTEAYHYFVAEHGIEYSRRSRTFTLVLLSLLLVVWEFNSARNARQEYYRNIPTTLPGMKLYRLPRGEVELLEWLVRSLDRFDTFVCLPGLNSLYFLTQKDPPSTCNATTWMTLFDDGMQLRLVSELQNSGSLGGVRCQHLALAWAQGRDISQKPLVNFINTQMRTFDEWQGMELMELNLGQSK